MSLFVDAINNAITSINIPENDFYHFEPWDVKERPDWVLKQAEADSVNLFNPDFEKTGNTGAHQFQSGLLYSTKPFRASIAASQTGKSHPAKIEIVIQLTGELPISMRHDRGYDTGIRRMITEDNIRRFGRFCSATREFLDNNVSADKDGTWDCGTIIGAGVYPREKIMPNGETIWVGTTQKALQEMWWPWITNEDQRMIPDDFINTGKANNGISAEKNTIYIVGGKRLAFITYESGFTKFEALKVWWCHFDEESPDHRCLTGAVAHCKMFSISMTPLRGITYTKVMFFPKKVNPNIDVFHASAYDSPYQTEQSIMMTRTVCEPWEIASKIWGVHSANTGEPYYDRPKIGLWIQTFHILEERLVEFEPSDPFVGIIRKPHSLVGGMVDVRIIADDREKEEGRRVWRIYEDVKADVGYFCMGDAAAGTEFKEVELDDLEAGDANTAIMMRPPTSEDKNADGSPMTSPVIVATIRSLLPPEEFGPMCLMACLYYNGALFAFECGQTRGAHNGIVYSECRDYPHWFTRQKLKKRTKNYKTQKGVDTTRQNRTLFFDCVASHFRKYSENDYPQIPDERILEEAAACVKSATTGGKVKPDHPRKGSLDMLICLGQGYWLFDHFRTQIMWRKTRGNLRPEQKHSFMESVLGEINVDTDKKKGKFVNLMKGKTR